MQTDLTETGLGDPSGPSPQFIKPGDLSAVIAASHGDFLIVVGDKNMKNETCMARKAGKLIEMAIDERISSLLESWAQQTGIKPGSSVGDNDRNLATLAEDALFERLKRISGISRAPERLSQLSSLVSEIVDMRRGLAGKRGLPTGDVATLTEGDQNAVAKLTKAQTTLVRLHKDLVDALSAVRRVGVLPKGSAAASATAGVPPHLDLGLGQGALVNAHYRPNSSAAAGGGAPSASSLGGASASPGALGGLPTAIPSVLKNRLVALVEHHIGRLEEEGEAISEAAGSGATALWNAYFSVRYRGAP